MTAPERIWDALHLGKMAALAEFQLTSHTEGAKEKYDDVVARINSAMDDITSPEIHQAALDRIAELEGALKDLADASEDGYGDNFVDGEQYDTFKDAASRARAVLAKGDG